MHLRLASWVTTIAALICTPLLVVPGTAHADHVSLLDATEPVVISASPARLAAASDATSAASLRLTSRRASGPLRARPQQRT